MKKVFHSRRILLPGIFFLLLIIDSQTAVQGAAEGIQQCFQTVVPALFPFFFITCWFNSRLLGSSLSFLRFPEILLSLPKGCGSILLTGLLGGYPVGAKTIADACESGMITKKTGRILLGYCNNAGPAFIFGICHILFASGWVPWAVWCIQILSAVMTGLLLPKPNERWGSGCRATEITLTAALKSSISIMALVCGWIVLFRIVLQFLEQLPFLRSTMPYAAGILELSNGCLMLASVAPLSLRFLLFSVFLCAGGLCVYLQTLTAAGSLGAGLYVPGKCIQLAICILLSLLFSLLFFQELPIPLPTLLPVVCFCLAVIWLLSKKCRKIYGNHAHIHV